jgi:hypothetical protein
MAQDDPVTDFVSTVVNRQVPYKQGISGPVESPRTSDGFAQLCSRYLDTDCYYLLFRTTHNKYGMTAKSLNRNMYMIHSDS